MGKGREINEMLEKILDDVADMAFGKSQELILKNSFDTGFLMRSGNVIREPGKRRIVYSSPFAEYVEFGCFAGMPHANVITDKGCKRLSELKTGDMVFTHKLRFMPIVFLRQKINRKIENIIIKTKNGRILRTTTNHPFILSNGNKINAEELKIGDKLMGCNTKVLRANKISDNKIEFYKNNENRKTLSIALRNSDKFKKACDSEKHRKNLSKALKGKPAWNKGKLSSLKTKRKIASIVRKWWINNPEKGLKIIEAMHAKIKMFNTSIELLTEKILIGLGEEYKKQFRFYDFENKKWYIFDFYLPKRKTIIECNGIYWHSRMEIKEKDEKKKIALEKQGYKVIYLWEGKISKEILCEELKITH